VELLPPARVAQDDGARRPAGTVAAAEGSWQTSGVDFEETYERFRRPVWRLARRLTGNEEEALDACQEIFLRVWKGLPTFRGDAKLSTWVFQIAWNYLRWLRRKRGLQVVSLDRGDDSSAVLEELVSDPAPDPERQTTATELLDRAQQAMLRLPEHSRVVLWLRDGEDLSYEEIAAVLAVPIGTVRSRLARARANLRELTET